MDQKILWAVNQMPKTDDKNLPIMGLEEIAKARTFHESFPPVHQNTTHQAGPHGSLSGSKGNLLKR